MDVEPLFPVFLKLGARRVVVVGAGPVAAGKAAGLVAVGASVVAVAPDVCDAMKELPVTIVRRGFRPSDLDGAWYVVAAAPAEVNRAVAAAAADRQIFVNAVDDPAPASAYAGSVVSRGPVTLAISTSGLAPAVAGLLREALDDLLPADLEWWVDEAVRERVVWKRDGVPMEARRGRLLDRLNELYRSRTSADSAELGRVAGDRR